jgi:enoyl-CoA hydratase/carnithine racemase
MQYQTIEVAAEDHVATVTINRPAAMNSFTLLMMQEFQHFWHAASEDDTVHAVVLRAAKGRAFSTGVDVKAAQEPGGAVMHDNVWTAGDPGEKLGPKSNRCWKPVVTAVHGMCAVGAFYWINE